MPKIILKKYSRSILAFVLQSDVLTIKSKAIYTHRFERRQFTFYNKVVCINYYGVFIFPQALRPWSSLRPGHRPHHAAGFGGPWIENAWCASAYSNDDSPASSLGRASAAKPLRSWEVISGVASGSWRSSWSPPQRTLCLREMFGPFIPVLLPWTDLWEPES